MTLRITRPRSASRSRRLPNGFRGGGYTRHSSRARTRRGATFFRISSRTPSIAPRARLDTGALASAISARGPHAIACASNDEILERMLADARAGDVALFMSNGPFDGLKERFLAALRARGSGTT